MTEPGVVQVTVARVCPSCDGEKRFEMKRHENDNDVWHQTCFRCGGSGLVSEPVTCASCKHWGQDSRHHLFWGEGTGFCALADCDGYEPSKFPDAPLHVQGREGGGLLTVSTFACSAWEAKP